MSDNTAEGVLNHDEEPDVEAHGVLDSNGVLGVLENEGVLAANDEEPDVEAHGVLGQAGVLDTSGVLDPDA